jgi:GxxExxY protein
VASLAVVELKAVKNLEDIHFATTRSYMKALDIDTGLLLNFAATPLIVKRVTREPAHPRTFVED